MVRQEHQYAETAVEYKLQYISEQRKNVATGGTAAAQSSITMALILGFDEVCNQHHQVSARLGAFAPVCQG